MAASPQVPIPGPPTIGANLRARQFGGSDLELDSMADREENEAEALARLSTTDGSLGTRSVSVNTPPGKKASTTRSSSPQRASGSVIASGSSVLGSSGEWARGTSLLQASVELLNSSIATAPAFGGSMRLQNQQLKTVLIADASSHIGAYVVDHLSVSSCGVAPVRAWVKDPEKVEAVEAFVGVNGLQGVEVCSGSLQKAARNCESAVLCVDRATPELVQEMAQALKGVKRVVYVSDGFALHDPYQGQPAGRLGPNSWAPADNAYVKAERAATGALASRPELEVVTVVPPHMVVGASLTGRTGDNRAGRRIRELSECSWWLPFAAHISWCWAPATAVARGVAAALYSDLPSGVRQRRYVLAGRSADLPALGQAIRRAKPSLPAPTCGVPQWVARALLGTEHVPLLGFKPDIDGSAARKELGLYVSAQTDQAQFGEALTGALDAMIASGELRPAAAPPSPSVLGIMGLLFAAAAAGAVRFTGHDRRVQCTAGVSLGVAATLASLCACLQSA
eukprot:Hpha_TRINITY_DN8191_c0_g1::TRINITY_DN8191_c0_g1_i1::g.172204::m.172204